MQLRHFPSQRIDEQAHELADLVSWPGPILTAKRKQCQVFDPKPRGMFNRSTNGFDASTVPGMARFAPFPGPTTVTVHDYGNVPGLI